eukprot:m.1333534 g.1333534  ORF g.1333534 m.1333534 type:complete len:248 (-) comp24871_c0_seq8:3132-3875(-)
MADPWSSVKEEVETSISGSRDLFKRWQQLLGDLGPTSDTEEFEWVSKEIGKNLKSISWDLDDLNETITIVENDPAKFQIGVSEINSRKAFVKETAAECDRIKRAVNDPSVKTKLETAKRSNLLTGGTGAASRYEKLEDQIRKENDTFIDGQSQRQDMIMKEQDTQLTEVGETIGVLRNMGNVISDELDDQQVLLEDFEYEMDSTSARLGRVVTKLDKTLHISKDPKQSCCICLLFIVLVIMIVVYIS